MHDGVGFTAELARYLTDGRRRNPPEHAVEAARELFLDTIGVTFVGAPEPVSTLVRALIAAEGGSPHATMIGSAERVSILSAALANGTAAHAIDLDDSHHPGFLHPSAVLVPAVLGLAEDRHANGAATVRAYLYGLDTIAALGTAINLRHYELGWHATSTIGSLAAAASASMVLELTPEQTEVALALAASQAGGVRRNFGSMAKPLHVGTAARVGVVSALLAESGFSAGTDVLGGDQGYFDLVAGPGEWDGDAALAVLDHGFELAIAGLGIKRFASCGVTHPPIEAALQLRERVPLAELERLDLVVNPLAHQIAHHDRPADGLSAKFSLPYCVAVAFARGAVTPADFSDDAMANGAVEDVRGHVSITVDDAVGHEGHMSFGCRLTGHRHDGTSETTEVKVARGKWSDERLTHDEVVDKYDGCIRAAGIAPEAGDAVRSLIERLDTLADIAELTSEIRACAAA